jgi:hypothetical protein
VGGGRSRSNSAPAQPNPGAGGGSQTRASYMPNLAEEISSSTTGNPQDGIAELPAGPAEGPIIPATVSSWRPLRRARTNIGTAPERDTEQNRNDEYEADLVDILDLVGERVLFSN